jgi:hypothetical protein
VVNLQSQEPQLSSSKEKRVDDFIRDGQLSLDHREMYAAGILGIFRLPAIHQPVGTSENPYKLFCDYRGERYRVTGASRLGDVWLRKNHSLDYGYDENGRVNITECSNFGPVA